MGFPWGDALALAARNVARSVTGGIGPPPQSCPLRVDRFDELQSSSLAWFAAGPAFPMHALVPGCFFLLRELELSAARVGAMQVLPGPRVSLRLSASTTDPSALSCTRA